MSHTPGPWKLEMRKAPYGGAATIRDSRGQRICSFTMYPRAAAFSGPTQMANAHLIAAAPDLLECLKAARDHLEYCGYGDTYEREGAQAQKLSERIASAIKAAEGK